MMKCNKLTIFEGPDGSGKTTAAKAYATEVNAVYIHHGPYALIGEKQLARFYAESMLPALQGYQHVVLDRCWLSETPYAHAFREGKIRLEEPAIRMLERLAYRCAVSVVLCLPDWETVKTNFEARKGKEYLKDEDQLLHVYEQYHAMSSALPFFRFNYPVDESLDKEKVDANRSVPHDVTVRSAGNMKGGLLLVGSAFAHHKDTDLGYQWPFASFCSQGCSWWLTKQLASIGYYESGIMWVNCDQDLSDIQAMATGKTVIALGNEAHVVLEKKEITHFSMPHPQSWKRFNHKDEYPLITLLKGAMQ